MMQGMSVLIQMASGVNGLLWAVEFDRFCAIDRLVDDNSAVSGK